MAWPGSARKRGEALGAIHRSVGEIPGTDPWGRPWDVQSEGRWNLENPPPESDTPVPPIHGCGPEQRYNEVTPMPGCPVAPGSLRYMAQTVNVPAGNFGTFEFTAPGIFCPQRLMIFSDDLEFIFVDEISTGTRNQIINTPVTGLPGLGDAVVPAQVFGPENTCCPISCLDCICAPGVKMRIKIRNTDVTDEDVTIVLIGTYYDIPAGMTARQAMQDLPISFPGCPVPGSDKLVAFSHAQVGGGRVEIRVETPGRFCPKQLFFQFSSVENTLSDVLVLGIRSTLDEQVISEGAGIPATLWSIENKCCILSCFDCLCSPGVPLIITVQIPPGESPQTLAGVLLGTYEDVC